MIWYNFFASGWCSSLVIFDLVNNKVNKLTYVLIAAALGNFLIGWGMWMICPKCMLRLREVDSDLTDNENYQCIGCGTKWLIVNCGKVK